MEPSTSTHGRQFGRFVANGKAVIQTAAGQQLASGELVDVSEGGLKVLTRVSVALRDRVEVVIALEGYPKEIRAQGNVARVQPDRIGIELTQTPEWLAAWKAIQEFYAPEPRLHDRVPAEGEATVTVASRQERATVENVSRRGMQVRCAIPAAAGDSVKVSYTPKGESEEISIEGTVARCAGGRIGIAFPKVSFWDAGMRKLAAFQTVKQDESVMQLTPGELLDRAAVIQSEAARGGDLDSKTKALWKMESIGVTFGRLALDGTKLSNPRLPDKACPIVHVGMGGAAVEGANFDRDEIEKTITALAHPEYCLFSYEQIGAMLGVYEKTMPRLMLGLKRLDRPKDPRPFLESFRPEVRRLISHGYGRLLYFNSKDLRAAWVNIRQRDFLDPRAAVQGMAFGYAMVNHNDIDLVLRSGGDLLGYAADSGQESLGPSLVKAFQAGLVFALEFWEWTFPGVLQTLSPASQTGEQLVAVAREEIAECRQQGFLRPFAVKRFSAGA